MAHTHEFDCKTCGAHLDSREELDQHNREKHAEFKAAPTSGDERSQRDSSEPDDNRSGI